jgi:crossover junction endodeoxyribonuclease RuvC
MTLITKKTKIVLGIDPGFSVTGFGLLKKEGNKSFLLDYGYLGMSSTKPLAERVTIFHDFFTAKITQWQVTDLALETPFLGKNAQNFLKLGYLRGMLYFLSYKHSLELHEFAPSQVKQSLTGFGGASKDQVARVIIQLFPKIQVPNKYDVTDALAITLCGMWHEKNRYMAQ